AIAELSGPHDASHGKRLPRCATAARRGEEPTDGSAGDQPGHDRGEERTVAALGALAEEEGAGERGSREATETGADVEAEHARRMYLELRGQRTGDEDARGGAIAHAR